MNQEDKRQMIKSWCGSLQDERLGDRGTGAQGEVGNWGSGVRGREGRRQGMVEGK